jgi:hypothetical protein
MADPRALQIDHVYSDGAEERRVMRGVKFLRHVLANIDSGRYQLLCASHNAIKKVTHFEDGRRFNLDAVFDLETVFPEPPDH